jgi:hypothetical protein
MNYLELRDEIRKVLGTYGVDAVVYEHSEARDALPKYELVASKGESEGEDSGSYRVFLFNEANIYIMFTGYYSSYEGTDWSLEFKQVYPTTKTITIYEP